MLTCQYLVILFCAFACLEAKKVCKDGKPCSKTKDNSTHPKESSKKYAKYLSAIKHAESFYSECSLKNCECFTDQISGDLMPFVRKGIDEKLMELTRPKGVLYQVLDGELYREIKCMFPTRCAGIEHFLLQVIENITDIELVINTRDYPLSSIHFGEALPIFSFSKTLDYWDISYPAWAFWDGGPAISIYPTGIGRWDLYREKLDHAANFTPWEKKFDVAFFRGSRTSSDRDPLVLLSRVKPDLVNAQYTKNQAWKSNKDTLDAPAANEVSLEAHCSYKYLFNYRGVAASFRHKHLFLCGSLVFHVGDEWTEFYYHAMKPWVHYIPVPSDATPDEIENLISFARDNDAIAKKIAKAGRDFVFEKLTMTNVICYWRNLLESYAKLLKYKPRKNPDTRRVQPRYVKTEL